MPHPRYQIARGARVAALLVLALAICASRATAQEIVTEVWVHDVPDPPDRDFWDSVLGNLFSAVTNPASIYPDVVVCARAPSGATRTCTQPVCWDLQGDTKRGGAGKSTECRRKLRLTLPARDTRLIVQVLEMDDDVGTQRLHEIIGGMEIADPAACTDAKPCVKATARGMLAVSFSTTSTLGPPAPATATPPRPQGSCTPSPNAADRLRGPYSTADEVLTRDPAGPLALLLTGPGAAEYGYMILRDRQRGGYYATSPIRTSQTGTSCWQRPMIQWPDYAKSVDNAIAASCASLDDFVVAADVHTHPNCVTASNSFSATDFNHAVEFKTNPPPEIAKYLQLEKIFMISDADHKVRMFTPRSDDEPLSAYDIFISDQFGIPYLSPAWDKYQRRVQVLTTYP